MLTTKQLRLYHLIRRCILSEGAAPTYRRMAAETGVVASVAHHMVNVICERGWLAKRAGRICLVTRNPPVLTATTEFDYFILDSNHPASAPGWPRLVDVGPVR